jgi:short chain dehydrogenase
VNNAGIVLKKPFTDFTAEDFDALVSTNLFGFFYITQRVVKEMLKQQSGCVVSITAALADRPIAGENGSVSMITKGGLNSATKNLRKHKLCSAIGQAIDGKKVSAARNLGAFQSHSKHTVLILLIQFVATTRLGSKGSVVSTLRPLYPSMKERRNGRLSQLGTRRETTDQPPT